MEINTNIPIDTASVKVMRSYDYCHFEVNLTTTLRSDIDQAGQVDELRKTAARLADKAVEQYKVAKQNANLMESDAHSLDYLKRQVEHILKKPEGERTPKEKAFVKAVEDRAHRNRRRYDYDDDWQEEEFDEPELSNDEDPGF